MGAEQAAITSLLTGAACTRLAMDGDVHASVRSPPENLSSGHATGHHQGDGSSSSYQCQCQCQCHQVVGQGFYRAHYLGIVITEKDWTIDQKCERLLDACFSTMYSA